MEGMPFLWKTLLSCDCCYEELGFKTDKSKPFIGPPEEIYHNGLTGELHKKWVSRLSTLP